MRQMSWLRCCCLAIVSGGFLAPSSLWADEKPEFKPYTETISDTPLKFDMVPIPGGKFLMGSPADEEGREDNEGPQVEVEVSPFWMATHEVTWELYDFWSFKYDIKQAKDAETKGSPLKRTDKDLKADGVTRPTPPYVDMTFGYGHDGYPAICMTQHSATTFCEWLSAKTGKTYRLPTEAEWEFACRAGSKTPFAFGKDKEKIDEYAWYIDNANEKPQPIGKKKPNAYGLYDMHGNVSEWCRDKYVDNYFEVIKEKKLFKDPVIVTDETIWSSTRGGSWQDDPSYVRSTIRVGAEEDWSVQDPQDPKSIWYHTDAHFVGLRVVRPLESKKE